MLESLYGDEKLGWCRKDMICQTPKEVRMKPLKEGTEFRSDNTKGRSAACRPFFFVFPPLKTRYTHTGTLRSLGQNQGLFNGAHETNKVWEYQQKCQKKKRQNLILPGHKVMREEAADDRQLNRKGRHLLGIRGLFILPTKKDVLSSKYVSSWRYNEGFPKGERHVNEGALKGQHTDQSCRGGRSLLLDGRWRHSGVAGELQTGALPPCLSPGFPVSALHITPGALVLWSEECGEHSPLRGKQWPLSPEKACQLLGRQLPWPTKSAAFTGCPFPKAYNVALEGLMAKQSHWKSNVHQCWYR